MPANGFMNAASAIRYSNPDRETVVSIALTERYPVHPFDAVSFSRFRQFHFLLPGIPPYLSIQLSDKSLIAVA